MIIDCVVLAMANLVLALLGLVTFVARDGVRIRAVTGRAGSSDYHRPKVIWVTNEVRGPSALATRRRSGRST